MTEAMERWEALEQLSPEEEYHQLLALLDDEPEHELPLEEPGLEEEHVLLDDELWCAALWEEGVCS